MRYIKMKDARPGMCLAYNMYDSDGHNADLQRQHAVRHFISKS